MSENRISADVDALRRGGVDIDHTAQLAASIRSNLQTAMATTGEIGGGQFADQFKKGYESGAERAMAFLDLLESIINDTAAKIAETGKSLNDANNDADALARKAK